MKKIVVLLLLVAQLVGCTAIVESKDDVYLAERDTYIEAYSKLVNNLVVENNDYVGALEKQYNSAKNLREQFEKVSPSAKRKAEYNEILTMFKHYEDFCKDMGGYAKAKGKDEKLSISADDHFNKSREIWQKYKNLVKEEG